MCEQLLKGPITCRLLCICESFSDEKLFCLHMYLCTHECAWCQKMVLGLLELD